MKQFNEFILERLKLNKDTKINNRINDLSINDICKDKVFTICMVNLKKDSYDLFKLIINDNDEPSILNWYIRENPKEDHKGIYCTIFTWVRNDYTQAFYCYTNPKIESSFLWFISKSKSTMYIVFNNKDEANQFIDNYDRLYKDEVKRIDKKYFIKNK